MPYIPKNYPLCAPSTGNNNSNSSPSTVQPGYVAPATVFGSRVTMSASVSNFNAPVYELIRIRTLQSLQADNWRLESNGKLLRHPYHDDIYIREVLIAKLGFRTEATYNYGYGWIDSTGYTWPIECIVPDDRDKNIKKASNAHTGCECGAKYTSFPDLHLSYCRMYQKP